MKPKILPLPTFMRETKRLLKRYNRQIQKYSFSNRKVQLYSFKKSVFKQVPKDYLNTAFYTYNI